MVITRSIIATGRLFTTNIAELRSLEPDQEEELYPEYNGGADPPVRAGPPGPAARHRPLTGELRAVGSPAKEDPAGRGAVHAPVQPPRSRHHCAEWGGPFFAKTRQSPHIAMQSPRLRSRRGPRAYSGTEPTVRCSPRSDCRRGIRCATRSEER